MASVSSPPARSVDGMTAQTVEEVLKEHWPLTNHQCRCKAKFVVTSLLREHIAKAIATAE